MGLRVLRGKNVASAALLAAVLGISGCSGLVSNRVEGRVLSENELKQIRPGQSQELVVTVLGSPQTTNTFGDETAFYYVETKVAETAFGMRMVNDRTVLAVYFDENKRVKDKAIYGLKDGRTVTIESRRTGSYGDDRTFVDSLIASIGN